ncbi:MAG: cell division protein FtsW [Spirochaetia bacterium]|nr:cell division protein FtsW [Spirochaetia bacterium]
MEGFLMEKQRGSSFDTMLLAVILLLAGSGMAMLFSASYPDAVNSGKPFTYFISRQALMFCMGSIIAIIVAYMPLNVFSNLNKFFLIAVFALNMLPPLYGYVNGASRWIRIGALSIQPSEFYKIALVLYLATDFVRVESGRKKYYSTSVFTVVLIVIQIVWLQSDLSTTLFIVGLCGTMFFVSKFRFKMLILLGLALGLLFLLFILSEPYRLERLTSHMGGNTDVKGSSYQIVKAKEALLAGGIFGRGIGSGSYKMGSLPEAKSDFIFAIVGEELGFAGVLIIILLFGFLAFKGYYIAWNATDKFKSYVAFGFTTCIFFQMLVNTAVVAELLPTTGITMPFFSQGGTSMLVTMIMCGFLLNVSRGSDRGDYYE